MRYNIKWCEVKKKGNTNGRDWEITEMTLVDEQGNETTNVSTFDKVLNGGFIEGEIVTNDKGYKNFQAVKPEKKGNSAYKEKVINETMERKEQSIHKFQDNKEWSIKVSSTMRDAVALAIAEEKPTAENIIKWRDWLWENWDVNLTDKPPF